MRQRAPSITAGRARAPNPGLLEAAQACLRQATIALVACMLLSVPLAMAGRAQPAADPQPNPALGAGDAAPNDGAPASTGPRDWQAPATPGENSGESTDPAAPAPRMSAAGNGVPLQLPHDLSPWGMFMSADIVVKGVMIGLFLASIVTWTVGLAKSLELMLASGRLRRSLASIDAERSLSGAVARIRHRRGLLPRMLEASAAELRLSIDLRDMASVKERVASRLVRLEAAASRSIARGTGVLATIGSTAPFVGLFGTVWGIMNSFIGISKAQTTNLAVVAPGIAEALLATAIGLVAAIPAVIIYNQFARWTAGYRLLVGDASAHVQRLVSRDLDRAAGLPRTVKAAE